MYLKGIERKYLFYFGGTSVATVPNSKNL